MKLSFPLKTKISQKNPKREIFILSMQLLQVSFKPNKLLKFFKFHYK